MGYSITFKPRNKKLGKKMVAFMRKNGRSFGQLYGEKDEEGLVGPFWANGKGDAISKGRGGLSYCHRKGHLGFDYGPGSDRDFYFILLKWMAQKIGSQTKGKFKYLYDGHEWIDIDPEQTDALGLPTKKNSAPGMKMLKLIGYDTKKIRAEMKRLNKLWEEHEKAKSKA